MNERARLKGLSRPTALEQISAEVRDLCKETWDFQVKLTRIRRRLWELAQQERRERDARLTGRNIFRLLAEVESAPVNPPRPKRRRRQ